MASHLSLQLPNLFHSKSFGSDNRKNITANAPHSSKFNSMERGLIDLPKNSLALGYLLRHFTSSRLFSSRALSSVASSAYSDQSSSENEAPVAKSHNGETEFNRVNCLVWVLHESARSFSLAVESLQLAGTGPELAMSWVGKDVHEWHKRIAHNVAAYALMKTAIEVEILLSHERHSDPSPVREILTPMINLGGQQIEDQLKMRHSELVVWFRDVELPRIAGYFIPLLKKWSMEYAGSGVAGIIVAISCCSAIGKAWSGRHSCSNIEDVLVKLMDFSCSLVTMDKLHHLATEGGFELDFLSHFGTKVLPSKTSEELEFWIGLAQKKLSVAFHRESVISCIQTSSKKVQVDSLATLGLFAYLGRRTRLFLLSMGIKDLDELVKDFLSYLECGSLFIYPDFSSISTYQLFMEVVTDEIGWLDFYAAFPCTCNQERRRSKQHVIQAEKEIILSTVFTVCYDVYSGFAHFSRSTQQPLDANLLAFLLRSQSLLTVCLEDYWAAYDKSGEQIKGVESGASDLAPQGIKTTIKSAVSLEAQQRPIDLMTGGRPKNKFPRVSKLRKGSNSAGVDAFSLLEGAYASKPKVLHVSLIRKYSIKLMSTISDIWMGTQLLFIDIMVALELLLKELRGCKVTKRERKKIKRTLNDIATLIPVTILMLLPVSAVGHAAMLTAINKYMPSLIPSPYSSERLDIVKQLERTKKMEVQSWGNLEDGSSIIS